MQIGKTKHMLSVLSGMLAVLLLICCLAACSSNQDQGTASSKIDMESSTLSQRETSSAASSADSRVEPVSEVSSQASQVSSQCP